MALQVLGTLGLSDRFLRWSNAAAAFLWAINNLLLGAISATAMCLLNVFRQALAIWVLKHSILIQWLAFSIFSILACLLAWYFWGGSASLASLLGTILAAYGMIFTKGATLRIIMGIVSGLWMLHAFYFSAYWQIVGNSIAVLSAIVGAWRSYTYDKTRA